VGVVGHCMQGISPPVAYVPGCSQTSACRAHSFPNLILKPEFPSSRILSVPCTVANWCVESGAVPFSVVWDQLPGTRLECYGHYDGVMNGQTTRGLSSLSRRQCPTVGRATESSEDSRTRSYFFQLLLISLGGYGWNLVLECCSVSSLYSNA
jgi:hypothetical protein